MSDLLREYEVAQTSIDGSSNRIWQVSSAAIAGAFAMAFLAREAVFDECLDVWLRYGAVWGPLITFLAIDAFWVVVVRRELLVVRMSTMRMADIEAELDYSIRNTSRRELVIDRRLRKRLAVWRGLSEREREDLRRTIRSVKALPFHVLGIETMTVIFAGVAGAVAIAAGIALTLFAASDGCTRVAGP